MTQDVRPTLEEAQFPADPADTPPATDRAGPAATDVVDWVQRQEALAPVEQVVGKAARQVGDHASAPFWRGEWLGHPLHPMLTDIPIGCWTSVNVLDLLGGRRQRGAAQLLLGLGIAAAVPTVLAGLAEFDGMDDRKMRRVGAAHATGNAVATGLYTMSFLARRRGRHLRGVGWALAGTAVASFAGFLGGHLAFGDDG